MSAATCKFMTGPTQGHMQDTDIKKYLESKKDTDQQHALEFLLTLSPSKLVSHVMDVLKFCVTSNNHTTRVRVMLFLERTPKVDENGKPLEQFLLACNAVRNMLMHANEYDRGSAFRLVTIFKDIDVLMPFVDTVRDGLACDIAFVVQNAIMAAGHIYQIDVDLFPDACEQVMKVLENSKDETVRRNAFTMLCVNAQDMILNYCLSHKDEMLSLGVTEQLAFLDLMRTAGKEKVQIRAEFFETYFEMLANKDSAIAFEAALAIVSQTSSPEAVRRVVERCCQILYSEPDNSIKEIVLERITKLQKAHKFVLSVAVPELLRVLPDPNVSSQVRHKIMELITSLTQEDQMLEVMGFMKKELRRCINSDDQRITLYRAYICATLRDLCFQYPESAEEVFEIMVDSIETESGIIIIQFLRAFALKHGSFAVTIMRMLRERLSTIKCEGFRMRGILSMMSDYSNTEEEVIASLDALIDASGELPWAPQQWVIDEDANTFVEGSKASSAGASSSTAILADGSYATSSDASAPIDESRPKNLLDVKVERKKLMSKHLEKRFYFCYRGLRTLHDGFKNGNLTHCVLPCVVFVRLLKKLENLTSIREYNQYKLKVLKIIVEVSRRCKNYLEADEDIVKVLRGCINIVLNNGDFEIINQNTEFVLDDFVLKMLQNEIIKDEPIPVDELIRFRQLKPQQERLLNVGIEMDTMKEEKEEDDTPVYRNVTQLSGPSDKLYVESIITIKKFDVTLEIYITNIHNETIHDIQVSLNGSRDAEVFEGIEIEELEPNKISVHKIPVRMNNANMGMITSSLMYKIGSPKASPETIALRRIVIDIAQFISPEEVASFEYQKLWKHMEWENRVQIFTSIQDLEVFLQLVTSNLHLNIHSRSPPGVSCLVANAMGKSVFNESVLVNIVAQIVTVNGINESHDAIKGHVRIRCHSKGMSVGVGSKLNAAMKLMNDKDLEKLIEDQEKGISVNPEIKLITPVGVGQEFSDVDDEESDEEESEDEEQEEEERQEEERESADEEEPIEEAKEDN
eukprot:TRINITY_DN2163_c0_g3_i1.p1 TRINITY_DN2163_c0_g3~~TRINITY_DN2163_c0_g3_i1.p1  ORF type:complete len:1029 (-),score=375.83 TRINITY_DN2163_c0_g3_i1:492-3578(-)